MTPERIAKLEGYLGFRNLSQDEQWELFHALEAVTRERDAAQIALSDEKQECSRRGKSVFIFIEQQRKMREAVGSLLPIHDEPLPPWSYREGFEDAIRKVIALIASSGISDALSASAAAKPQVIDNS